MVLFPPLIGAKLKDCIDDAPNRGQYGVFVLIVAPWVAQYVGETDGILFRFPACKEI